MTYTAVCLGVSPYEVTCEMMTQWFASQDWKPETRKSYRNTVSSFFAWMRQTGRFGGHVEESYIGDRLSSLLGDGWTAHSLRHRYATATWQATHDLLLVSKLLGHASVETTQVYVAMPDERLRAGMAAVLLSA